VLETLQTAAEPLSVDAVARQVGLHANTVRFHLDALVGSGYVDRQAEVRDQPGRPRVLYSARPEGAHVGQRSYQLLASILTSYVAAQIPKPKKASQQAGHEWGRYLAERPPPFRRLSAAEATGKLVETLDDIGFAPEATTRGRKRQVLLHRCPFREAAEQHQDVVCSIHLGLMQGLLDELDVPLQAERLDPFVEPNLCVTHLAARAAKRPVDDRVRRSSS
jgi:predicted ArsR family transcriptional regulator